MADEHRTKDCIVCGWLECDCTEEEREAFIEWERQRDYWRPRYEGEKLAGLLPWKDGEPR